MSLAPAVPAYTPTPVDVDDIYVPADDAAKLLQLRYALDAITAAAEANPGVLAPISEDLAEAFVLLLPAAEYVEAGAGQ